MARDADALAVLTAAHEPDAKQRLTGADTEDE